MENFKTLEQIKTETLEAPATKRYYRSFDYARAVALTQYLENLATDETFRISSIAPLTLYNRDADDVESTKTFAAGLWTWYLLNGVAYYVQMTDNPFFPAYVSISREIDGRKYAETGLVELNETFYYDCPWDAEPETIAQLVKNIGAAVKKAERFTLKYTRDLLSYRSQFKKQEVYMR